MTKVYAIASIKINDREVYANYEKDFMDVLSGFDGRLIGFGEPPEVLEGSFGGTRAVLMEFGTRDELDRWYNSERYQEILKHRLASSEGDIIMVPDVTGN